MKLSNRIRILLLALLIFAGPGLLRAQIAGSSAGDVLLGPMIYFGLGGLQWSKPSDISSPVRFAWSAGLTGLYNISRDFLIGGDFYYAKRAWVLQSSENSSAFNDMRLESFAIAPYVRWKYWMAGFAFLFPTAAEITRADGVSETIDELETPNGIQVQARAGVSLHLLGGGLDDLGEFRLTGLVSYPLTTVFDSYTLKLASGQSVVTNGRMFTVQVGLSYLLGTSMRSADHIPPSRWESQVRTSRIAPPTASLPDTTQSAPSIPESPEASVRAILGNSPRLLGVFASNDTILTPESKAPLMRIATLLNQAPTINLEIKGHADTRGSSRYNKLLSAKRATTVCRFLVSQGIALSRITVTACGSDQPVATNETEEGRDQNRKVELILDGTPLSAEQSKVR